MKGIDRWLSYPYARKPWELSGLGLSFPLIAVLRVKKLAPLIDGFKAVAASIVKSGLSAPVTSMALKRRRDLKLPEVRFSPEEAAKIYREVGLSKLIEESR
ncbi:MAG: hypothetical protein DRJ97_04480 [Thermoprotei archaeon]|nr:MAG: hypothetical protein DRJ97_04480 [Thermoprotei archaeon]